jgi:hypothetical protein
MKLHVVILHRPGEGGRSAEAASALGDAITLRRRMFSALPSEATGHGGLDDVSTHILIYQSKEVSAGDVVDNVPVAVSRVVHRSACRRRGLPFPAEQVIEGAAAEHRWAYANFRHGASDVKQVGYLALSHGVRRREDRTFLLEAMHWLFAKVILATGGTGLVGFANRRYKNRRWVEPLGSWPPLPDLDHPQSPDPHELILLKHLSTHYLKARESDFAGLLNGAKVVGELSNA